MCLSKAQTKTKNKKEIWRVRKKLKIFFFFLFLTLQCEYSFKKYSSKHWINLKEENMIQNVFFHFF